MKMRHTVTFQDGTVKVYEFKTKPESDKAIRTALECPYEFVKYVLVAPIEHPDEQEKIDFIGGGQNDD